MRKKIDDGGFETPYRLRKQAVEPVFGQIKQQPLEAVHPRKRRLSRITCQQMPVATPIWTGS